MEHLARGRYFDREWQVESVRVLPGQYYVASGPGSISTVVGSCVSTCLWDPVLRVGGLNHFMLPGDPHAATTPWGLSARFGVYAMELLINEMLRHGADRRRLVAKVFGGAQVLQGFDTLDVGAMNSEFVLNFLREEEIAVAAHDLRGAAPRKLHFFSETGKVQLKRLHLQGENPIHQQEWEYRRQLASAQVAGEIEIFTGGQQP